MKTNALVLLSVIGGFALSFLGLGLLWIGIPFPVQFAHAALFFLLTYTISKTIKNPNSVSVAVIAGATPIASLFVRFRNNEDSHLFPILIVLSWLLGTLLGAVLSKKTNK